LNTIDSNTDVGVPGSNGGLIISSGGVASGTTVQSGFETLRGGVDSGTTLFASGTENVSGGLALNDIVLSGGHLNVLSSGATASATMVSGGGLVIVSSG